MRRRHRSTSYARRSRDLAYLRWVKTLGCSAITVPMPWPHERTTCSDVVEADHMGARGLSAKCDDREAAPICTSHHRERSDHAGMFQHATKAELRVWTADAIARTQAQYVFTPCECGICGAWCVAGPCNCGGAAATN